MFRALVLGALLLGAWPHTAASADAGDPAAAPPWGTVTWAIHVTLAARWFDPAEAEASNTPYVVLYALHDALVKPAPGGLYTPSLAESWSMAPDGKSFEFVLREGIRFHDGEAVTADDVKFSFERYRGAAAELLHQKVRAVEVIDARHVRFVMNEPWPDFMVFYGTTSSGAGWIVPRKYVQRVGEEGFRRAPIGAGPYRFVSYQPGVELVAEAFEGYWRKMPSVKRIVLRSIPEETTRAAALMNGEVDVAYLLRGPIAEQVRRSHALTMKNPLLYVTFFVDFPDQWDEKSPWHDVRVRQAASLAIDRQALNEAETLGFSRLTGSIIPKDFEFALDVSVPPYDVAKAKQLLAEAGYAKGFDAGDFYPYPPYDSLGEAIAGYLQAVGIRTRLRSMERAAFFSSWRQHSLHGVVLGVTGTLGNAATRLESHATRTGVYAAGSSPDIDELFQRQTHEMDRAKREADLHQIQRLLEQRVIYAPLYQAAATSAFGARVADPALGAIAGYPFSAPYEDVKLKDTRIEKE